MAQSIAADVAKRVVRLARAVEQGSHDTLKAAADTAKDEQLKRMRADSGGDLKLSGVNKAKGRPGNTAIGVKVKVSKTSAQIMATGPLQIINNDTSGHVVRSAYSSLAGGGRRKSTRGFVGPMLPGQTTGGRRAVINIPGVGYRRSARHPGTSGKDTWQVGRKSAEPKIRQAMGKRTTKVLANAMKG